MRWDFILFFASLIVAAIGGEWGAYIGIAGMAAFGAHGLLVHVPPKARKMTIILGLIASGSVFIALLVFLIKPGWFGLISKGVTTEAAAPISLDHTIAISCAWSKPPTHYRE